MTRARLSAWAELLRVSALFTVPGDALAGAACAGLRPNRGTAYAVGASLFLYEAGMALNDWADREEDAVDRPHRPIPSGRITPTAALTAAAALTATGLTLASRAGRPALALATALTATVWSYDLHLKHTRAAPATMATARALDLLLGTAATLSGAAARGTARPGEAPAPGGVPGTVRTAAGPAVRSTRPAAPPAAPAPAPRRGAAANPVPPSAARAFARSLRRTTAAGGSGAVPPVSRPGSTRAAAPSGRLTGTVPRPPAAGGPVPPSAAGALARSLRRTTAAGGSGAAPPGSRQGFGKGRGGGLTIPARATRAAAVLAAHTYAVTAVSRHEAHGGSTTTPLAALAATAATAAALARPPAGPGLWPGPALLAAAYLRTAATPYLHAALNPSPPLTQRAVGGGIRAMIPLQAALAVRSGAGVTGLAVMALVPIARRLARKVSPT
ncbi:UbiA family prenyltransferase [Streptomyces sp. NPDC002835]